MFDLDQVNLDQIFWRALSEKQITILDIKKAQERYGLSDSTVINNTLLQKMSEAAAESAATEAQPTRHISGRMSGRLGRPVVQNALETFPAGKVFGIRELYEKVNAETGAQKTQVSNVMSRLKLEGIVKKSEMYGYWIRN